MPTAEHMLHDSHGLGDWTNLAVLCRRRLRVRCDRWDVIMCTMRTTQYVPRPDVVSEIDRPTGMLQGALNAVQMLQVDYWCRHIDVPR